MKPCGRRQRGGAPQDKHRQCANGALGVVLSLCDPALPAGRVQIFWRPEFVPTAVLLTSARARVLARATSQERIDFGATQGDQTGPDGRYVIFADFPRRTPRPCWSGQGRASPVAVAIPLDEDFAFRIAGALRFPSLAEASAARKHTARALQLTARYRARLMLMLRAVDMRDAGCHLSPNRSRLCFGPAAVFRTWLEDPAGRRGRTIRLVQDAYAWSMCGYLRLLRADAVTPLRRPKGSANR